jgi:dipeptidyl-peptidase-4
MRPPLTTTIATLGLTTICLAQGDKTLTLRRVIMAPGSYTEPLPRDQWIPDTQKFSRMRPVADRVMVVDATKPGEKILFTGKGLNGALAAAGSPGSTNNIVTPFTWHNTTTIRIQLSHGVYRWRIGTAKAELILPLPKGAARMAIAADDSRVAFVVNHQLYIQIGKAEAKKITGDGSKDVVYGGGAHRQEFGIHDGLWWSPDNRFLAFFREDLGPTARYPFVDHTTMPPKALHGRYPMAGGANSYVQVGVCDVADGKVRYLSKGTEKDIYWTNATFGPTGASLDIAIVNRGQDHMTLARFDPTEAKFKKTLFEEKDEQWIEPEHGPIFLEDKSGRFLWFSPRDGYRHLYLYDATGKLLSQVTKGEFDVREFVGFRDTALAYVMASGENPLELHLWEVNLKTSVMRQVTKDRGQHRCKLSSDGAFVHDTFSNLSNPGQSQVILLATGRVSHIVRARHRFPVMGKQEFFSLRADDGTKLHGTIILPPGLDTVGAKKYPCLLYVYGGPHSQLVKDRWLGGSSVWLHYMATRGFIICTLDNRGTDNRGIEFSQAVHRRLSELEVRDQLQAIAHLKALPYVDSRRIGVHGWSYGGYMTLNLMLKSPRGTFACGASGAPVTDWRQYETGYTERYMDTPKENPRGYASASVIPVAKKLTGRLLVIHGTDDKTVMWSHSLAFVDKCIESGVLVDYMPYPMQKHGIRGRDRLHLYKLLTRFFDDHLKTRR